MFRAFKPIYSSLGPCRLQGTDGVESSYAAFNASLLPGVLTRASTDVPDKLYNFEIRQYEPNGNYISGTGQDYGTVNVGEHLNVTLAERNDCQLVLVARGSGSAVGALGNKSLSDVQNMVVDKSVIQAIDPAVTGDMNKIRTPDPYQSILSHF